MRVNKTWKPGRDFSTDAGVVSITEGLAPIPAEEENEGESEKEVPTSATAIAVVNEGTRRQIRPLIVCEVKKGELKRLVNLKELLLQAYHSLTYYCVQSCVYCLTDGMTYDYYMIAMGDRKLEIQWFKQITMEAMGEADVRSRIKFLQSVIASFEL